MPSADAFEKALRAKYDFSLFYPRAVNQMRMFAAAAEKAKSLDPVKVAAALEGMEFDVYDGGKGTMRKDDHQFFQPMYIASFGDRTEKEPFDEEKTGWGWRPGCQDRAGADHAPHHLQNGTPELDRRHRASFPRSGNRRSEVGSSLRGGVSCSNLSSYPR